MSRFFPNYEKNKITSKFGNRTVKGVPGYHNGIDLVAMVPDGSSATDYITAHSAGTVQAVGYDASAGNYVNIQVNSGTLMVYYHLKEKSALKVGSAVKQGQIIGYMGSTGNSTGAHLHWGIKKDGKWIDPEPYLDKDYPVEVAQPYCTVKLPVLKPGDSGDAVKAMQILLIGRGYPLSEKGATGKYGSATEKALHAFKEAEGLKVTSNCGVQTWSALLGV